MGILEIMPGFDTDIKRDYGPYLQSANAASVKIDEGSHMHGVASSQIDRFTQKRLFQPLNSFPSDSHLHVCQTG